MFRMLSAAAAAAVLFTGAAAAQAPAVLNDFPTEARADYVLGCMTANGQTADALRRCSCSIDVIATIIPFKRYEEASTFISMGQVTGEAGAMFRGAAESKAAVGDLKRAQAEAEMRCF